MSRVACYQYEAKIQLQHDKKQNVQKELMFSQFYENKKSRSMKVNI
jgi:hypothetical protein